jgi:hypothetical protein
VDVATVLTKAVEKKEKKNRRSNVARSKVCVVDLFVKHVGGERSELPPFPSEDFVLHKAKQLWGGEMHVD